MKTFLDGLDDDLKEELKRTLAILWTYSSNAIEGNTLTLGDTNFIIREGLTIAGKKLREIEEATNHYNAVNLVYSMLQNPLTKDDIFKLHRFVMPSNVMDVQNPIGNWKENPNGTMKFDEATQTSKYIEYPSPMDIDKLMSIWIDKFNTLPNIPNKQSAIECYSWVHTTFVSIHPFFDGNGRMARLLANIPILRNGLVPITISPDYRREYITILGNTQIVVNNQVQVNFDYQSNDFEKLLSKAWQKSYDIVEEIQLAQRNRNERNNSINI